MTLPIWPFVFSVFLELLPSPFAVTCVHIAPLNAAQAHLFAHPGLASASVASQ